MTHPPAPCSIPGLQLSYFGLVCFFRGFADWPEPQRGIAEAYRVIKPGGLACLIGPVHPTHPLSRFFADLWMLFPTEQQYLDVGGGASPGRLGWGMPERSAVCL